LFGILSKKKILLLISAVFLYEWDNPTINPINATNDWWCKKTDAMNLGYNYDHDEPTLLRQPPGEIETCLTYRHGLTPNQIICLDDRFCSLPFPFVCEICMKKSIY
jgi:hypothetical protein